MYNFRFFFKIVSKHFAKYLFIFWSITFFSFFVIHKWSPDHSHILAGNNPSTFEIENIQSQLGKNISFISNYIEYIRNFAVLNLGTSYETHENVLHLIKKTLPISLAINLPGFFISFILSLFLAFQITYLKNKKIELIASTLSVFSLSLNHIVLVIFVQILFCSSDLFNMFPVQGWNSTSLFNYVKYSTVPILCIIISTIGYNTRFFVNLLKEEYKEQYYKTLDAFGTSKKTILYKYLFKNCFAPIFTYTIYALPFYFMGGFIILERLFNIPGLGFITYRAISSGDLPLLKFLIFFTSFLFTMVVFFSDMIISFCDPRQNERYE